MSGLELTWLNGSDVDALALGDEEILAAVRRVLAQQGRGETVIEPRVHLFPRPGGAPGAGHFNVLRGATAEHAGVKVVGDFVENHRRGLPSELALLLLLDPDTGVPSAIVDATAITEMRTGAVTAIGASVLARQDARILGHIGARGTAYWNVRLLAHVLRSCARSASTPAGPRAARRSRAASRRTWTARFARSPAGRSVCAVPMWWSRPAAW
jgi:alanine dehydrogenase